MNQSEVNKMIDAYEAKIREAQLEGATANLSMQQQQMMMQDQGPGMIKEQLDSSEEIERIYDLLKGYSLIRGDDGVIKWTPPANNDMIILSEYGMQFVMGKIVTYLTKNTLLSNYSEEQIATKMEDISNNINDTIFMEYDKMFLYPTLQDCQTELKKRIQEKIDIRIFARRLLNQEVDEKEVEAKILKEMEGTINRELEVIKQQKMKSKLKRFESLVRDIQDTIHSAYQRAYRGEERKTLRQHSQITENRGGMVMQQPPSSMNPFKMLGRHR